MSICGSVSYMRPVSKTPILPASTYFFDRENAIQKATENLPCLMISQENQWMSLAMLAYRRLFHDWNMFDIDTNIPISQYDSNIKHIQHEHSTSQTHNV